MKYPERIEIVPLAKPPAATVRVPGSKSITNRALVLAAIASKGLLCELRGVLLSEDTKVMMTCLGQLGFDLSLDADGREVTVSLVSNGDILPIPKPEADLFVGNSGTTMRFLTALVSALGCGRYRLDGISRMRERPIEDLLAALRQLGVRAYSERNNGCPPVIVESNGLGSGHVRVRGNVSSQFVSALLMVAPEGAGITIDVEGALVSEPYVAMTVALMRRLGFVVQTPSPGRFHIPTQSVWGMPALTIEPDASAASYFWGAAAVTGGAVTVPGLSRDSIQGDVRFADLLEQMGCRVERETASITVYGGPLRGIDVDMNDISDTVMTLGAVALFAEGPTTIRNVAHIRHKETDRLAALAAELSRVGAEVAEFPDGLRITPRPLHGAEVETYNDHRMAMSMALVGLKVPGVVIKDPGCVAKTYPNFFSDLENLRDVSSSR
ncbi:MAG TPA: 3-phosphoshikimate 1-carboxyvinyltransferase [Gemmataceae bacterium]|nr:3-phosphoshikimate 1-carboxyvinyltransferase [Gemmataceae bacterium]